MSIQTSHTDTIVALATPQGIGAIGVIRLSGKDAIAICNKVFGTKTLKKKDLNLSDTHTLHFGVIHEDDIIIDEVLVSLFKAPHSYTSENTVELSCHGSPFIQQQIIQLLIKQGARMANQGEFTLRAFLNGKLDLSQAEAVADLISSNSASSHQIAIQQMRGGFSNKIKLLRQNLIDFASLIELELDFSEEDVEFADRTDLKNLVSSIQRIVQRLIDSFEVGNVIKNGIPVAIVGKPNAGKSTLLNVLLEEDRAIVSDIPGTTRDVIEDEINIDGVMFRVIDTAGIREANDIIESIGVEKTFEQIKLSSIAIYLFDVHEISLNELKQIVSELTPHLNNSQLVLVANKIDKEDMEYTYREFAEFKDMHYISAKEHIGIDELKKHLVELFDNRTVNITETIVTNARHAEALRHTNSALIKVLEGLNNNVTGDFLAMDIRQALHYLGTITGEISSDDLLTNIFSRFCIGK
ncbi:MAG: tRNA uridine-5-carboxymethylaminomethyl(34) synthesis GTPase MnmE [Bacteroidetes bacterium]|nr:tRNA uridine-5-carboxymethylaminomethyl(34) synthesis GTPase MnmE [Bacteroidota bacterium]